MSELKGDLSKHRIEQKVEKKIISTGLDDLDDALEGGFKGGNLYVLSGAVCSGKHTFMQSILCNAIENGTKNIVYFSTTDTVYGVTQRLLYAFARIPFLSHDIDDDQWYKLVDSVEKIVKSELCIQDLFTISVNELKELIEKNVICKNANLIIIDDYHFIEGHKDLKFRNYKEICSEWEYVAGEIKKISKEKNIPVLVLSEAKGTFNSILEENTSIATSTVFIEKVADTVIFMSYDEWHNKKTEISIKIYKKISGDKRTVKCAYIPEYRRFENMKNLTE